MDRCIVIGGYGRSGTTIIRDVLATHPRIVSFGTVESKFFSEAYGLVDLFRALVSDYTISRGAVAINEFRVLMKSLLPDPSYFGQASILEPLGGNAADYERIVDRFLSSVRQDTIATYMTERHFFQSTKHFVDGLIDLIQPRAAEADTFLEKTPHDAHNPWIFQRLFSEPRFVWIVRDPRAIVYSLTKQEWSSSQLDVCCTWVKNVVRRFSDVYDTVPHLCMSVETIADDPTEAFSRIGSYCNIPFTDTGQMFDSAKLHDWTNYLTGDSLEQVERSLSEEIQLFKSLHCT